jgi:hypothetical protein
VCTGADPALGYLASLVPWHDTELAPHVLLPLQVGVSDASHVFVHWSCHGTNLHPTTDNAGRPHKPTFHESHISGIDFITFNEDRSKLQEVVIYRCACVPQHSCRRTHVHVHEFVWPSQA